MLVYRLCSERFTALDGEGARRYGGRWNSPGTAVIYTAETVSLAILETRVHLTAMPEDYVLLTIEIGDRHLPIMLPASWRLDTVATRLIGDRHFESNLLMPLKVPSVIASRDHNYVFSKEYAERHAEIISVESFWLDRRLWTGPK